MAIVKVQKSKDGSYRMNIPKEIIEQTGWDDNTELVLIPFLESPSSPLTPETPIIIKKIIKYKNSGDRSGE